MLATEARLLDDEPFLIKPPVTKRIRTESTSSDTNLEPPVSVRNLELESVKKLFQDYDLQETEAVSCVICGKNYKSKVCVKKHLWEHSVYWDLFDGLKKQQRVLSIQAAIILAIKFNPSLSLLLVTNSSSCTKKKSTSSSSNTFKNQDSQPPSPTHTTITASHPAQSLVNRKRKADDSSMTYPRHLSLDLGKS